MKKALLTLLLIGTAVGSVASAASAQSFYFGIGSGDGWGHHHHHYESPYRQPYYQPYQTYGYSSCYYRTRRYFDDYQGVWVVRRVRVCD